MLLVSEVLAEDLHRRSQRGAGVPDADLWEQGRGPRTAVIAHVLEAP